MGTGSAGAPVHGIKASRSYDICMYQYVYGALVMTKESKLLCRCRLIVDLLHNCYIIYASALVHHRVIRRVNYMSIEREKEREFLLVPIRVSIYI